MLLSHYSQIQACSRSCRALFTLQSDASIVYIPYCLYLEAFSRTIFGFAACNIGFSCILIHLVSWGGLHCYLCVLLGESGVPSVNKWALASLPLLCGRPIEQYSILELLCDTAYNMNFSFLTFLRSSGADKIIFASSWSYYYFTTALVSWAKAGVKLGWNF